MLTQMRSCLLDEVTCLVEAHSIAFRIADRFADSEIVSLSSVTVFSRAFEAVDGFLFKLWYCYTVSRTVCRGGTIANGDVRVAI
jgi:hypothetical protein